MKNKNILELCLADGLGGLEMFVASCYEDFSTKGICKVAVTPDSKLDKYLDIADKFHLKRNKFFPFVPAIKLAKYIDENDIDVMHFHWTRDMMTAVLAKVLSHKKPKLVQSRHMRMTRFKDDLYHKWLYKNIDTIHAVTNEVKLQLEKFIPADIRPRLEMIYLGTKVMKIDEEKIKLLKAQCALKEKFVIGIVGRIEDEKGQYKVIEAVKILQDLDIKALIVGSAMSDVYFEQLHQKVEELGIEEKIVFVGFTKDVGEYMQLFDVNVLATTNETFGLVVIEAMLNKIPVIATNKGGPLEIIDDGVDGLLFDGRSEDLANKIKLLYQNNELKKQLTLNGYLKVTEKFNYINQMEKLYEVINES